MNRIEYRNSTRLQLAIGLSVLAVFIADILTPLGTAVWVFYLIPVILCIFGWLPAMPIVVSTAATLFTITAFFTDAPGIQAQVAAINRVFGMVTIWTMGVVVRQFLVHKIALNEQAWLRIGQTALSEQMQGGHQLSALAERILRYICEYAGAQAGSLYISKGDGTLQRYAAYALDLATTAKDSIRFGEGLTGQAAKSKHVVHLKDLPNDYFTISSTMGTTNTRHLLIAPATADGEVEAIVELGFVHAVGPHQIKLLEQIGEPVGMAIRTSRYRSRLEALLQETQRQAEQLQMQSEELRVANEELEEQSRILKESQMRLESQQVELEEINAQLEGQATDLENQKQILTDAQMRLARHADDLARASQYKSEFLANMSHELRTPLNSTLILAKLLGDNKDGNMTAEQVKFAETIYSAGNDLLDLINDVLDLSKIEAGKVTARPETVPIARAFDGLARTFRPLAEEKGIHFDVTIDEKTPPSLVTDLQRWEQILKNLLSNAVKFTKSGSVTLRAFPSPGGKISFTVADTGIGISEDQHAVIFEAFRQADGSTHRQYGGTGLGLSISKDLAALLGGQIGVESTVGKGSTFTLTLPASLPAERSPASPSPAKTAAIAAPGLPAARMESKPGSAPAIDDDRKGLSEMARTLLIIEDDERFARILFDLGHEEGFQCIIANTAADAIQLADRYRPKAIVLDINLPDQSGLYVLDQLKRSTATRHIPVHVASVGDYAQTALELGAVSYALKPVRREELSAALRRVEARMDQPMRRILVVEDDDRQRETICRLLEAPGVQIDAVATATETLQNLKVSGYDCVVMDLGLEDMSGYELLDRMAAEKAYSFPPVIVYTGRPLQAIDEQKLRRYSKSIIIKGARSPERLLDEVTLFLHKVESSLPADQQRILQRIRNRDAALEGRRILIVEDDVRNVFAITSILEPKGAKIEVARTGKEALDALDRSVQKNQPFDLVLMDIMMPEMDGLTAMREIRRRPELAKLPIVALTAKAMPDDRDECLQAGANDYISKPLDVDKLLSLVRVWIRKPAA